MVNNPDTASARPLPNGPGAAAILSAAIGIFVLEVVAVAADVAPGIKRKLIFYRPTGPLSGVTTLGILVWLAVWLVLDRKWRTRTLSLGRINRIAFVLLALGLLLTFPPVADLL